MVALLGTAPLSAGYRLRTLPVSTPGARKGYDLMIHLGGGVCAQLLVFFGHKATVVFQEPGTAGTSRNAPTWT